MTEQSYAKHAKLVPFYHYVLLLLVLVTLVGAVVNLFHSLDDHSRLYNAALILALSMIAAISVVFVRTFPLKAQDRAIRAEENLRHFVLTGKLLDSRLSIKQIVALRFASDMEFPTLASKAAAEAMPANAIKQSIKNWKVDHDRL